MIEAHKKYQICKGPARPATQGCLGVNFDCGRVVIAQYEIPTDIDSKNGGEQVNALCNPSVL